MIYPIKNNIGQPYIEISTGVERSSKGCFLTADLLEEIKGVANVIEKFRVNMVHRCNYYKECILSEIVIQNDGEDDYEKKEKFFNDVEGFFFSKEKDPEFSQEEYKDSVTKMLQQFLNQVYEFFSDYLVGICIDLGIELFGTKIKQSEKVRVHFRYYKSKKYVKLVAYDIVYDEEKNDTNTKVAELSQMGWDDLLVEAYKAERPLIYSANKTVATKHKLRDCWKNFITVIPKMDNGKNYHFESKTRNRRGQESSDNKRPWLTFGITTNTLSYNNLLYVLDYFDIDRVIGEVIDDFLYYFDLNFADFFGWLNNKTEET